IVAGLEPFIDTLVVCTMTGLVILLSGAWNRAPALAYDAPPEVAPVVASGEPVVTAAGEEVWAISPVRVRVADEVEAQAQMREGSVLLVVVEGGVNGDTGMTRHRVYGRLSGSDEVGWTAEFDAFAVPSGIVPKIAVEGVYFDLKGATLTAKAFDRVLPGLGGWIVPLT